MSDDKDIKLIEVLSKHYSETFDLVRQVVARRDRLFLYILLVIFVLLLYMSNPEAIRDWVNSVFSSQLKVENGTEIAPLFDVSVIGAVLLLGLLSLSHTYFQAVLHVERQYDYVYKLEDQLSKHFEDPAFTREGRHYLKHQHKFSGWTKSIFWYLFPFLYLAFMLFWMWFLVINPVTPLIYKIVDFAISLSILNSLRLYLLALNRRQ
ncbi:MAG: hypothetical protein C3F07_10000 [Anaerolineales bacterium]|nr:hypothetical protein [Anaerolineae bacterium]PWB73177.1 MAG: hypothetical protein C3F07_10000 [Anaerolineales bacterium]